MLSKKEDEWLYTISGKRKLIDFNFKEIWRYRDLLFLFVKRDIVTLYKQTILGPLWYLIQPLFTSVIFTLIFNNLGQIKTGSIPPFLFNLAGITAWNYFRDCLNNTSSTFTKNQNIFGKVYFPRVILPMSITISNLLKFGIQLLIFIGFFVYYYTTGYELSINSNIILFPVYVVIMAMLGLGLGMIFSSLTTKYRDITVLLTFAVQLLMYVSAVPYPMSEAKAKFPPLVAKIVEYNPLTQIMEGFRYMLLDIGEFNLTRFLYTLGISLFIFLIGLVIFNRTEKSFIDTV
ncbi:ABC transporter permease [Winogradskyella sp. YYF002]|uniref:Transport permease protein n=1 Tax=Winogradskyella marincola TaxID=3037795 RepID=A0ABT6FX12_9FLAO|nr:ABC transporter permease [Winogradskyella sp. YYF002]MDG4714327.1 ABC transporter permease [Winogradskyella sp. YYF002]